MFGKTKIAALVAEFLGTGILALLFLSVSRSQLALAFFIAAVAGLAYAFVTYAFGKASGGYFNPALTIADWTVQRISSATAATYVAVQLLGGWLSYYLFTYFVAQNLPASKGLFNGRILAAEAVGAGIFAFGWAATRAYHRLSANNQASFAGLSYMVGVFAAATVAGVAILNPAVALGSHVWVWGTYVAGPVIGAIVGVNLYERLFAETSAVTAKASAPARATTKKAPAKKKTARAKKK